MIKIIYNDPNYIVAKLNVLTVGQVIMTSIMSIMKHTNKSYSLINKKSSNTGNTMQKISTDESEVFFKYFLELRKLCRQCSIIENMHVQFLYDWILINLNLIEINKINTASEQLKHSELKKKNNSANLNLYNPDKNIRKINICDKIIILCSKIIEYAKSFNHFVIFDFNHVK